MKSVDLADFLGKLGQLLHVFDSGEPDPLKCLQRQRLNTWKALLNGSTVAKSRTQKCVQRHARQFASNVLQCAGRETLFLCMAEYSISSLPKIVHGRFYQALAEWSRSVQLPDLLKDETLRFWDMSAPITEREESTVSQEPNSSDAAPPFLAGRHAPLHENELGDTQTILDPAIENAASTQEYSKDGSPQSSTNIYSRNESQPEIGKSLELRGIPSETILDPTRENATVMQECPEGHNPQSPTNIYNRNESQPETRKSLEVAFLVPPDLLDVFYRLHKDSTDSQHHSAILTVPTQDRVASLVLSIPRTEAALEGDKHQLPVIFNSRNSLA
ncbi:hypothetical protein IFM60648_10262 [Aspergillus lentulus]|uniref:Uncharacterized protein n=1 Tax=Aspergillus lentulus TaxID=293939 RepID=A0ABQ1B563_ASPLE|nr:hypothetical protein IFM60648_10262 [Aspergillus lentulus]